MMGNMILMSKIQGAKPNGYHMKLTDNNFQTSSQHIISSKVSGQRNLYGINQHMKRRLVYWFANIQDIHQGTK